MVIAPGVIGATAGRRLKGASEIGQRKRGDLRRHAERDRCVVEGFQCGRQLGEQILLPIDLISVRIEATKLDEKDLPLGTGGSTCLDHLRDLVELIGGARLLACEYRRHRRVRVGEDRIHRCRKLQCLGADGVSTGDESIGGALSQQLLNGGEPRVRRGAAGVAGQRERACHRYGQRHRRRPGRK